MKGYRSKMTSILNSNYKERDCNYKRVTLLIADFVREMNFIHKEKHIFIKGDYRKCLECCNFLLRSIKLNKCKLDDASQESLDELKRLALNDSLKYANNYNEEMKIFFNNVKLFENV